MSLAYAEGKDGKLQVAYEAMDKISIFKHTYWIGYCPCHDITRRAACFDTIFNMMNTHIRDWHSDDD